MLKDEVKFKIQSGRGGRGSMALVLDYANGGDGGNGGNVYVVGRANIYDLSWFDDDHTYKAGNGEDGERRHKTGDDGKDMILEVPLTTDVYVNGFLCWTISKEGQRGLLLKGGRGSLGNIALKRKSKDGYIDDIRNEIGLDRTADVRLVFKLQSDAIFLGYPNAGKSSLLNAMTNSTVKTANYAFTTLEPQLGMMGKYILMDLPGLIEGAHEGKGLGTKFVKHTESAKLLVHMVSLENDFPWEIYQGLRTEIAAIDPALAAKPELVVLTKSDETTSEKAQEVSKLFMKHKIKTIIVSILDDAAVSSLKAGIAAALDKIETV